MAANDRRDRDGAFIGTKSAAYLSAPRHYPVDPWLARRQGILLIADGFPVSRIGAPAVYSSPRGEVPGPFKLVETSAFLFILLC